MMKQSFCSFSCLGQQKFPEPTDPLQRVTFTPGDQNEFVAQQQFFGKHIKDQLICHYYQSFKTQHHLKALSDSQVIEILTYRKTAVARSKGL